MNITESFTADILIVDDTLENLELLSEMLTDRGYEIRIVKSGAMALRGVQAQPPDLILLDIMMPEMDGYEVCRHLKANPQTQDIPVIFISALNEALDKVKAFRVGGVDYITKPFQVAEVCARVTHQLTIRRLQAELLESLEQQKLLNRRIEEMATLEERNRIARDIHDSLGHALVALNIQLEAGITLLKSNPEKAYTFLTKSKELGSEALQAVRRSVSQMRDDPLQGQLLETAIANLIQDFYATTGTQPECQIDLSCPPSHLIKIAIYRILQEGLTNICKHAGATKVSIQIQSTPSEIWLALQDNGKGFETEEHRTGFGLQGMQERTTALGGNLEIESELTKGCQISVFFPNK